MKPRRSARLSAKHKSKRKKTNNRRRSAKQTAKRHKSPQKVEATGLDPKDLCTTRICLNKNGLCWKNDGILCRSSPNSRFFAKKIRRKGEVLRYYCETHFRELKEETQKGYEELEFKNNKRNKGDNTYVYEAVFGKGLKANKEFQENDFVCWYSGRLMEQNDKNLSDYVFDTHVSFKKKHLIIDAKSPFFRHGRYINHAPTKPFEGFGPKANVRLIDEEIFHFGEKEYGMRIVANEKIEKDEPILIDYGNSYWEAEDLKMSIGYTKNYEKKISIFKGKSLMLASGKYAVKWTPNEKYDGFKQNSFVQQYNEQEYKKLKRATKKGNQDSNKTRLNLIAKYEYQSPMDHETGGIFFKDLQILKIMKSKGDGWCGYRTLLQLTKPIVPSKNWGLMDVLKTFKIYFNKPIEHFERHLKEIKVNWQGKIKELLKKEQDHQNEEKDLKKKVPRKVLDKNDWMNDDLVDIWSRIFKKVTWFIVELPRRNESRVKITKYQNGDIRKIGVLTKEWIATGKFLLFNGTDHYDALVPP